MSEASLEMDGRHTAADDRIVRQDTGKSSPTRRWLRALELAAGLDAPDARTLPDVVEAWAERQPDAPALLSDRECFTYGELAERTRRYARWARAEGFGPGTVVALLLPGRPDMLAAWLGMVRTGATVALLNPNLRGAALAHAIAAATPAGIIVDDAFGEAWASVLPHLTDPPRLWRHGSGGLDAALADLSGEPLGAHERTAVAPTDRALLIYTSGTTGLPKAANVSHRRIMTWSLWFAGLAEIGPDERMYDCLPLHHSVGGVVAPGCMLAAGGSVAIRDGFSAGAFWTDVARWDCTLFQYIGELCRYLLRGSGEIPHNRVRLALGNGLGADVWHAFKTRFDIPEILEFYAATEGSFSLTNVEGRIGSVGRVPSFLKHRFPAAVIRHDLATGLPSRGSDGLCVRVPPGEAGEAIGAIGGAGSGTFEGYTNRDDSDAKVLRDVFAAGDRWFRTGDLMRIDAAGFFYFVDRIGDTFRWKGENVATTEVAAVLAEAPGVVEAAVYGVAVPGHDGRAGMAAIVPGDGFSLAALRRHLDARLPAYAQPVFLRTTASIAATDTFKQRKVELAREGFDPAATADPLYVLDRDEGAYLPLDGAMFSKIEIGTMRL